MGESELERLARIETKLDVFADAAKDLKSMVASLDGRVGGLEAAKARLIGYMLGAAGGGAGLGALIDHIAK